MYTIHLQVFLICMYMLYSLLCIVYMHSVDQYVEESAYNLGNLHYNVYYGLNLNLWD